MKFTLRHLFSIGIFAALAAFLYSVLRAEPARDAAPISTTYFEESKAVQSAVDTPVEDGGWKKASTRNIDTSKDLDASSQAGSHRNPWRKNNTLGASHIVYPNNTAINGYPTIK